MKDKAFWFLCWPLVTGSLVGFGVLGPGAHPWIGWENAIAGGANVLGAIACGVLLGLRIRQAVGDSLSRWATGAQALLDQEERTHEETVDVLFDLAYGVIGADSAREYLKKLDADEEEPTEEESH